MNRSPNPWVYPGVYAFPNSPLSPAEEAQLELQRIAELESEERVKTALRTGSTTFSMLTMAAALGTTAYAMKRGNTIPRAVGAGLIWPLYLTYALIKGD